MKALMIVAPQGFRDEELFRPKEILEKAGIEVVVASTTLSSAQGMLGGSIIPDMKIAEVKVSDFDAVIFVGGVGAQVYWEDSKAWEIIREAVSRGKILGAICIAPVTLANAGVLEGKKATVWPSEAGRLKAKGASYTANPVEKDGNIITASGPQYAEAFGEEILTALKSRTK